MITTATLRDRWADQREQLKRAQRVAKNDPAPINDINVGLEKARLKVLDNLLADSEMSSEGFRNWLIKKHEAVTKGATEYPPGDKRTDWDTGAAVAYTAVLEKWDEMNENRDDQ